MQSATTYTLSDKAPQGQSRWIQIWCVLLGNQFHVSYVSSIL